MIQSQLSAASVAQIEASAHWRRDRVQIFDLPEGQVIVKGHRPLRSAWRHRLLNVIAWIFRAPHFRAVPVHGGAQSQAIEIRRLQALAQVNIPVPMILHVAPDYFVMRYLGEHCLGTLINIGHLDAYRLWEQAGKSLRQAHAAGQYMSQCFGRNVIVDSELRGFIDFEDDPLEVFSLQQAQVRDWLIFLHSTLAFLRISQSQLDAGVAKLLADESLEIRQGLRQLAQSIGWLRHLPANPKTLGRDLYRVQSAARALHHWATHS
jgi:hypothetical protein